MVRRGLGKGLEALIPSTGIAEETAGVREIPVEDIEPNPYQPRHRLDRESLQELAQSIREHGLIQPLVVTEGDEPGRYRIIAGERRWQAAKLAGLKSVPALVREATPRQMLEIALVENVQRADLNPLEEAEAYRYLAEEFGLTQEEIARRVGKSRAAVANTLRLLRLPDEVKTALAQGLISEGHARALLALPSPELQIKAMEAVLRQGLSVRQTEELVRKLQEPRALPIRQDSAQPELKALEERFQSALGTRVRLKRSRKGWQMTIFLYSDEEIEALYERLTKKPPAGS